MLTEPEKSAAINKIGQAYHIAIADACTEADLEPIDMLEMLKLMVEFTEKAMAYTGGKWVNDVH